MPYPVDEANFAYGSLLSPAAASGTGSVTAVTGVSPIASSGGDTPAISYNGGTLALAAGATLTFKAGSNARVGTGTLVLGTLAVANTSVTANSLIFLTCTGGGTIARIGIIYVSSVTPGTGFTVTSRNFSDNNSFNYLIVETD